MSKLAKLPARAVLAVTGEDRVAFLQGLVSNDVAEVSPGRAIWAALLTPQGKWLADFFILSDGERLLLDCERMQLEMLRQRLSRYRLRSRAALSESDLQVYVAWDGEPAVAGIVAADPRLPAAGWRVLSAAPIATNATAEEWDLHRLVLGLPDGSRDMESEKSVLLEAGFDELNGVSWTKGCYMGQELTARTKYRGLIKRRLVPVRIEGATPAPGTPLLRDGREAGVMRSAAADRGMALVRLESLDSELTGDGSTIIPALPNWARTRDSA
jgi:tRNA-modifying protein YgfZ